MPPPTDRELLRSITEGQAPALRTLYQRHADRVYNTALSYLQNTTDAEEVTQDVFTKAWKYAKGFKGNSQVTTWLYRITVNTALTALKKRQRRKLFSGLSKAAEPPDFHHPEAKLTERESNRALFATIYRLPTRQKTAFVLSYVEELPRKQVAEVMGVSLKSVESLLTRAKKELRRELSGNYPGRGKHK